MNDHKKPTLNRRGFLAGTAAFAAVGGLMPVQTLAQSSEKLRIGMMLPATGTFATLGDAVIRGFKQCVDENGGKFAGRELEFFHVDDESNPSKAPENVNRLIQRDKVDLLVGTVHSGVALAMSRVVRANDTPWMIPVSMSNEFTGALCAPNVFRTGFTTWQTNYPMGKILVDAGYKKIVHLSWNYLTAQENLAGFKAGLEAAGGKLFKDLWVPFPSVEFQAMLTELASIKPDVVVAWFPGASAVKWFKDYAAAGLRNIPMYGNGHLTEGILHATNGEAEGVHTVFPYADGLDNPKDKAFRAGYMKRYNAVADTNSVTGYDSAQLFKAGLEAVKGDIKNKKGLIAGMEAARIDSPRGQWTLSKAHNPIQDFYLRKVVGKENRVVRVAAKALADPATGCKMV
ncbi:MAG: ABC transporter substrate-binding protein [Lacisediminimonas sp.]|nr:ABC transporter substrate-binding protein [Lacisediminimonas sp.]